MPDEDRQVEGDHEGEEDLKARRPRKDEKKDDDFSIGSPPGDDPKPLDVPPGDS